MKVGLIGLGRMGEGMSRRMMAAGHEVWGYRRNLKKAEEAYEKGYVSGIAYGLQQLSEVVHRGIIYGEKSGETVYKPAVFMMVIPAELVEDTLNELLQFCNEGDIIVDHGNSNFKDSRRRQSVFLNWVSNTLTAALAVVFTVWSVDTVLWLVVQILQYPSASTL